MKRSLSAATTNLGVADLVLSGISCTRPTHRVPVQRAAEKKGKLAGDGTCVEWAPRSSGPTDHHLVMQVRVRMEAPLPQLREQTDQPPHIAHSFLK